MQMIGRGTRLCPKVFGDADKKEFYIFDGVITSSISQ